MASKRELERRIKELEERITQLENMHAKVTDAGSWESFGIGSMSSMAHHFYSYEGKEACYCSRQLTAREIKERHEHPLVKERGAWTKKIPGVTHEELAQLVLDGKPIERRKEGKVVYTTTYTPGTKTQSVKTDIGDISIQHDFKR